MTFRSRVVDFNEQHRLLGNPIITQKNLNTNFICSQRTENQKFNKTENVMSERVKMPSRHFLRCDYLHILFDIKFLLFVCSSNQISNFFSNSCNFSAASGFCFCSLRSKCSLLSTNFSHISGFSCFNSISK